MNFGGQDTTLLVAPRPVRLPAGSHFPLVRPNRLVPALPDHNDDVPPADPRERSIIDESKLDVFLDSAVSLGRDSVSPRAPSRSSLPSEALEEFLSILRPSSLFSPSSPLFRARHGPTMSLPSFTERSPQMRALHDLSNSPSPVMMGELDRLVNGRKTPHKLLRDKENADGSHEALQPGVFHPSILSSPVSRYQTRNPFYRHPSYEVGLIEADHPMSPSRVPLPSPTPTELDL
ncbi:hypothetical protein NEOLEDRAFT_1239456 [Neolentinus lepideus HHB14362 ss-1]|uniref:Uncharacterized protein n=1 Tax=Neolentinus lepideus HHB14362 ss-1 TaxID=1314782 RepID=A0A165UPJ4_9AGAM|nr:hypothetical protein NEOLEDRAFT_1239456 [Neolentinus lepideus HHB14362 ss-1]